MIKLHRTYRKITLNSIYYEKNKFLVTLKFLLLVLPPTLLLTFKIFYFEGFSISLL